jgi:hypothetical protein
MFTFQICVYSEVHHSPTVDLNCLLKTTILICSDFPLQILFW